METEFGKCVKQIRGKESLRTMATKLGITPAFLSAIETGKKKIPFTYCEKISKLYNLIEEQKTELFNSICLTNGHVDIDITNMSEDQKKVCMMFARKIGYLNEETINNILLLLK